MPPTTHLFVVMSAYGQTPTAVFDNKGKVAQWLLSLDEIPYLSFFRVPVTNPLQVLSQTIYDFLPDYVPPGEEPPVEEDLEG